MDRDKFVVFNIDNESGRCVGCQLVENKTKEEIVEAIESSNVGAKNCRSISHYELCEDKRIVDVWAFRLDAIDSHNYLKEFEDIAENISDEINNLEAILDDYKRHIEGLIKEAKEEHD